MTGLRRVHVAQKAGLYAWSYDLGRRIGVWAHVPGRAFLAQALCGLEPCVSTLAGYKAERELGALIPKVVPKGGDRKSNAHDGRLKLTDLGIEHHQSSRQLLAALPSAGAP